VAELLSFQALTVFGWNMLNQPYQMKRCGYFY